MDDDTVAPVAPGRARRHRGDSEQPIEAALVPDALLTVHTVARLYGWSPRTVLDKVRSGDFPEPMKMGQRWIRWPAHVILADLRRLAGAAPVTPPQPSEPA